jgi:hypothetical protein
MNFATTVTNSDAEIERDVTKVFWSGEKLSGVLTTVHSTFDIERLRQKYENKNEVHGFSFWKKVLA